MQRRLTRNRFTTNANETRGFRDNNTEKIVFISYRRKEPDMSLARKCAGILECLFPALDYWLDEDDKCMKQAHAENDDLKMARCIEQGLDVSSALLGIIGPKTFDSPWIPYEIGGARGRQLYMAFQGPPPNPFIAHLIDPGVKIKDVPAFVGLGTPLRGMDEVISWAEHLTDTLQERDISQERKRKLENIYETNTRGLKLTEL